MCVRFAANKLKTFAYVFGVDVILNWRCRRKVMLMNIAAVAASFVYNKFKHTFSFSHQFSYRKSCCCCCSNHRKKIQRAIEKTNKQTKNNADLMMKMGTHNSVYTPNCQYISAIRYKRPLDCDNHRWYANAFAPYICYFQ